MLPSTWVTAGLEIRDRGSRRAVVRGPTMDGNWLVRYLDAGADVALRVDEMIPVAPGKEDRARVISGNMTGEVVTVLGIDGTDAVVGVDGDVKMYKLTMLCTLGRL